MATPRFRELVVAPVRVRNAFAASPLARRWWAVILRLHGKPCGPVDTDEASACIASGFRFYAGLYGALGALLLTAGVIGPLALPEAGWNYGCAMATLAGVYLLAAAQVAWAGAGLYRAERDQGATLLILFLGMVTVFLALFLGVASGLAHEQTLLPGWLNAVGVWSLVVVGIGSYAVELVYLLEPE